MKKGAVPGNYAIWRTSISRSSTWMWQKLGCTFSNCSTLSAISRKKWVWFWFSNSWEGYSSIICTLMFPFFTLYELTKGCYKYPARNIFHTVFRAHTELEEINRQNTNLQLFKYSENPYLFTHYCALSYIKLTGKCLKVTPASVYVFALFCFWVTFSVCICVVTHRHGRCQCC